MNEYQINEYQIAFLCGVIIAALWIVAYLLCWCGQWVWAWVDDGKTLKRNLIVCFLAERYGFKDDGDNREYYSHPDWPEYGEGAAPFFLNLLLTSFIPLFLVTSFNFYPIVLSVLLLCVFAWLARFSRRHKKLFDKHIKDKDAHN